ncbi:Signal recognition particle receptor FtsY [wastewater metagenome]|uniref:Flagellar biosynthesis protein FlhF n=2 Tax=unclassified sequences TaxID=12908 RepID=A0A5B8RAH1_9ZZZZ|nr:MULTISPECIES: flagellar biosynthesis protein FlhF [Arhodomonas]QEA03735.1 signal recognition particle receptor FtsY [uncultured organism]
MKIKRVFAEDMRSAMRQVRESHGADAVILSSRRVEGGVEVISAVDYDEQAVREAVAREERRTARHAGGAGEITGGGADGFERLLARADADAAAREDTAPAGGFSVTVGDDGDEGPAGDDKPAPTRRRDGAPSLALDYERFAGGDDSGDDDDPEPAGTRRTRSASNRIEWTQEPAMQAMREELRTLRSLFENQLTLMEWQQMGRATPARATLMRRLHGMGFGPDVCRGLADAVTSREDPDHAWREAMSLVTEHVATSDDEIIERGGAVAVVGPTGVGKTTTVAKLAARFTLRHGRNQVALVTTDNFRIGGQEQLRNFARILGVPVHAAADGEELAELLDDFSDRRLVLIDTAGMSQRDMRLAEQMRALKDGAHRIRPYLVLSANTQLPTLMETLRAFRAVGPVGCILSKVDEAASLGGVLTAVMRGRLPIAYVADGQRVPEDLRPARADALVGEAEALAADSDGENEDDESLAVAFAGSLARQG